MESNLSITKHQVTLKTEDCHNIFTLLSKMLNTFNESNSVGLYVMLRKEKWHHTLTLWAQNNGYFHWIHFNWLIRKGVRTWNFQTTSTSHPKIDCQKTMVKELKINYPPTTSARVGGNKIVSNNVTNYLTC